MKIEKLNFSSFSGLAPEAFFISSEERGVRKELYKVPAVTWLTVYRKFPIITRRASLSKLLLEAEE
eukprot:5321851-Pyramimonas_sp.AAC.1